MYAVPPIVKNARADTPAPCCAAAQVVAAYIDASNVPRRYMQPLHDQCWTFPHKLVFFLYGTLTAEHATGSYDIPPIDTYFMLECNGLGPLRWSCRSV
jgi:hypothetical protein